MFLITLLHSSRNLWALLLELFRSSIQVKLAKHLNLPLTRLISIIFAISFSPLIFLKCFQSHNSPLNFLFICHSSAQKYHQVFFKKEQFTAFHTFISTSLIIVHHSPRRVFLFYLIFLTLRRFRFYWLTNLYLNPFWKRNATKIDRYMKDG